jgi:hypothetical protein
MGMLPGKISGQTTCGIPDLCLTNTTPSNYKCIVSNPSTPLTFSALIASGDLLSQSSALTTPQYLIVSGPIIADVSTSSGGYTFASGSEIIFVTTTSGINIGAASKLNINGTFIHGCTSLWNTISATPESTLNISNSQLENAAYAVSLSPRSTFSCTSTTFNGNYVSIYAGTKNSGSPAFLLGFNVTGCTFSGATALYSPYTPDILNPENAVFIIPNTAILVQNVTSLKVGNEFGALNTFQNYYQTIYPTTGPKIVYPGRGVRAFNSNVTVVNSKFTNFGASNESNVGYGVSALSETKSHKLTLIGLGGTDADPLTFENVFRAASVVNASLTFKDASIQNCYEGVYASIFDGLEVTYSLGIPFLDISENRIEGICKDAILLDRTAPSNVAKISKNTINFNSSDVVCGGFNRGILINNTTSTPLSGLGYVVSENTITHESSPVPTRLQAIEANGVSRIQFIDNTVTDEDANNDLRNFTGILLNLGSYARMEGNNLAGSKTNYAVTTSSGINNIASGNVLMLCNTTDEVNRGVNFNGFECDATDFKVNTMNTHAYGLYLQEDTRMGDQLEKQNYWEGSSGQVEGNFEFSGYDPDDSDDSDEDFVKLSRFVVDILDETDERWANPRMVGNDDDNDNVWFFGSRNNYFGEACAETFPGPTRSDNRVFNDSFPAYRGFESTVWEAKFHTFGRLYEDTTLRASSSSVLSWYNNNYDSTYAALYRIYADMNALGKPNAALVALSSTIDSLILERDTLETAWYAETVVSAKAALFTQLETLSEDVAEAQAELDSLMTLETAVFINSAGDLRDLIDNLATANIWETNLATVLDIVLSTEMGTDTLTNEQEMELDSIAQQCRIAGGFGVRLARHVLGYDPTTVFAADTSCVAAERTAATTQFMPYGTTRLYPNPASNVFYLEFEKPASNREVRIYDPVGRMVAHTTNVNGVQHRISLDRASAGLYLVYILQDNGSVEVRKIQLNKN